MFHRRSPFRGFSRWLMPAVPVVAAGCHHGGPGRFDRLSEAELREELREHAEDVLDRVDASDTQVAAVQGIVDPLAPELIRLRDDRRRLRERLHQALGGDKVDRADLEKVRREALALADRASARGLDALADAAEVLTAKQRAELLAKWKRRHRRW